jgi:hypothetical protein
MRVLIEMIYSIGIEQGGPPLDPVDDVPFLE